MWNNVIVPLLQKLESAAAGIVASVIKKPPKHGPNIEHSNAFKSSKYYI